jgi:hypothetical protein
MQATSFAHGVCAHYDAASSSAAAYHLKLYHFPNWPDYVQMLWLGFSADVS